MKYKFSAIITFITFFACVDHYDIESFSETQYEPYSNLGFEDGLEHWHGQANTFSSISIDSDAFEGLNSLKISINSDSSSQTENFDQSLAEISKSLDVYQGDTILVSYQLRNSQNSYENIHFFNTSFFQDKDGFLVQSSRDTIQNISISWNAVNAMLEQRRDIQSGIFPQIRFVVRHLAQVGGRHIWCLALALGQQVPVKAMQEGPVFNASGTYPSDDLGHQPALIVRILSQIRVGLEFEHQMRALVFRL